MQQDAAAIRDAVGTGIRSLTGFDTVAVVVPGADALWQAAAEGAALGGYRFEGYKTTPPKSRATRVVVHADAADADTDLSAAPAVGEARARVKDQVSIPAGATPRGS